MAQLPVSPRPSAPPAPPVQLQQVQQPQMVQRNQPQAANLEVNIRCLLGLVVYISSCLALYGQLGVFFFWSLPNLLFGEVCYFQSWPSGWAHILNLF